MRFGDHLVRLNDHDGAAAGEIAVQVQRGDIHACARKNIRYIAHMARLIAILYDQRGQIAGEALVKAAVIEVITDTSKITLYVLFFQFKLRF